MSNLALACIKRITLVVLFALQLIGCGNQDQNSPPNPHGKSWQEILQLARGSTVNFFMWGGDDGYNRYIDRYAAPEVKRRYGITLKRTPISAGNTMISKLLDEKQAGRQTGATDLMWINGTAFKTGAQARLWYGPWAPSLPNARYIDWQSPTINRDFGYPVKSREAPWSRAQMVMIYDAAHMARSPPRTLTELLNWAKKHPGRFTYPAPPDFTGTAFIEQAFILLTGKSFQGSFKSQVFAREAPKLWRYLNALKPYLWRRGRTYPASTPKLNELYQQGETFMAMSYNPQLAQRQVDKGLFPPTTRTFVFDAGTLTNVSYLAIPFNAPHKAGAEVVTNFLESPAAQINKQNPAVLGALTVLDSKRLSSAQQAALSLRRGPVTLSLEVLRRHRIPEVNSSWVMPLVKGWQRHVAR